MIIYLPDTNVFSQIFKGNQTVTYYVENIEVVEMQLFISNVCKAQNLMKKNAL